MGYYKYFNNLMENKLYSLHTAYLAKVISVKTSNRTAKILPLYLVENEDTGKNEKQSALSAVPFIQSIESISKGDIAVVICCERDISEAKKGKNVLPPTGRHSMSDSIIIGIL